MVCESAPCWVWGPYWLSGGFGRTRWQMSALGGHSISWPREMLLEHLLDHILTRATSESFHLTFGKVVSGMGTVSWSCQWHPLELCAVVFSGGHVQVNRDLTGRGPWETF